MIVAVLAYSGLGRKVSRVCSFVGERENRYEKGQRCKCVVAMMPYHFLQCQCLVPDVLTRLKVRLPSCDRRQVLRQLGFLPKAMACPDMWRNEGTILCCGASEAQVKSGELSLELISI